MEPLRKGQRPADRRVSNTGTRASPPIAASRPRWSSPDGPRRRVFLVASTYRGETDAFVADVHRYDGWWAEALTHGGSQYHGYIQEGSVGDEGLRLEGGFAAGSIEIALDDIDAIDIRYSPHRWVVPWEL